MSKIYRVVRILSALCLSLTLCACMSDKAKMLKAVIKNDTVKLEKYLDKGMAVDKVLAERRRNGLHLSSIFGYEEMVTVFVEHEANTNRPDELGKTPLFLALEYRHGGIVDYLLNHGAEINQAAYNGKSTLMVASNFEDARYVRQLLDAGADPNQEDMIGNTPLFYACKANNLEAIELLLDLGVDVNHRNRLGQTPLMIAAGRCDLDITKRLIDQGADIQATERLGCNALHHALFADRLETSRYLLAQGIQPVSLEYDRHVATRSAYGLMLYAITNKDALSLDEYKAHLEEAARLYDVALARYEDIIKLLKQCKSENATNHAAALGLLVLAGAAGGSGNGNSGFNTDVLASAAISAGLGYYEKRLVFDGRPVDAEELQAEGCRVRASLCREAAGKATASSRELPEALKPLALNVAAVQPAQ